MFPVLLRKGQSNGLFPFLKKTMWENDACTKCGKPCNERVSKVLRLYSVDSSAPLSETCWANEKL